MRWAIAAVELWLLIWFVLVGWEAFMQRAYGQRSPFNLLEFHHGYFGAGVVALGFWLHTVTGTLVQMLGLVFTMDDLIQHIVQTEGAERDYTSPLHRLLVPALWRIPGVPQLAEFLDTRWWALALLGGIAWFLLGCGATSVPLVPMVWRPDTRAISGVFFDSAAIRQTLALLRVAFPKEAAVCLYGEVRDSVVDSVARRLIYVERIASSATDSADATHVWFANHQLAGCPDRGLVGIAHSHPLGIGARPCTHSDPDANVLFLKTRALVTVIFCADGRAELFYQDGRREPDMWARRNPVPP